MLHEILNLEPKQVMFYFYEILQIPRPSKKEEKIINYLTDFSKKHKLAFKKDEAGNILISKPATKGNENQLTVVLQSHIDMVCEKNSNVNHNFEIDNIEAFVDGEWIKARGTTLGADDGIGMAAQLAILASDKIEHGSVECLFTVDEETGLTGAFALQKDFFTGRILINLDSEDEGEIFIGCAGGIDTVATIEYTREQPETDYTALKITISGLKGGHSGDDIHRGFGNSNKILNRFLWNLNQQTEIRLAEFNGGNLRNAIPREAFAVILVPVEKTELAYSFFDNYSKDLQKELHTVEPGLNLKMETTTAPNYVIDKATHNSFLNAIYACPHGVISWSQTINGLVETSTNLASVKFEDNKIIIATSQRSSSESLKWDIASMVKSVFVLAGAVVKHGEGYPGWTPDKNSEILKISAVAYENLFKTEPVIRAIHAGLECGLFLKKYPDLDMISFGPTIKGAHSPDESLHIGTTQKFWDLLLEVLKRIPRKQTSSFKN